MIEVCVAIALSAVVLTAITHIFVSCLNLQVMDNQFEERLAMVDSIERILAWDMHATSTVSYWPGNLEVSLVNGTTYHYYIDGNGLLVRSQLGGGTAVIAGGVASFQPSYDGHIVKISFTVEGGTEEDVSYTTLASM